MKFTKYLNCKEESYQIKKLLLLYDEKCKMLNSNPVVAAKHFQYRLECLLEDILLSKSDPRGKLLYYAIKRISVQGLISCTLLHLDKISSFARC